MERLIKIKESIKKKTPVFTRADAHKKARIGTTGWRKPKGIQNKMRLNKKGYRTTVRAGYKTPTKISNTYKGLIITQVSTLKELTAINPKTHAALLGSIGRRKKEQLIQEAKTHNITLVNLSEKAYQEKTKRLEQERVEKKKALAEKAAQKKKAAKDAEKKKTLEQTAKEAEQSEEQSLNAERSGQPDRSTERGTQITEENTAFRTPTDPPRSEPQKKQTDHGATTDEKEAEKKEKDKILTSKKGY